MPNLDGTGPDGKGPKTGRGLGKCEGANHRQGNEEKRGLGRRRRPMQGGGAGIK